MAFAEDQEEILARLRRGIRRERLRRRRPIPAGDEDVEEREPAAEHQERRAEPHRRVRVREAGVDGRLPRLGSARGTRSRLGTATHGARRRPRRRCSARLSTNRYSTRKRMASSLAGGLGVDARRARVVTPGGFRGGLGGRLGASAPRATSRTPDPSRSWCRSVD